MPALEFTEQDRRLIAKAKDPGNAERIRNALKKQRGLNSAVAYEKIMEGRQEKKPIEQPSTPLPLEKENLDNPGTEELSPSFERPCIRVLQIVGREAGVSVEQLLSANETSPIARPRALAYYLLRIYLGMQASDIATLFRRRGRTVIAHIGHIQKRKDDSENAEKLKNLADLVEQQLATDKAYLASMATSSVRSD